MDGLPYSDRLLQPVFDFLTAYTPSRITITENTAFVNLVAHLPCLLLATLLFSPSSTRLLRAALTPFALAVTFHLGLKFRHAPGPYGEQNYGLTIQAAYWSMKCVEMGLRRTPPAWSGWEQDEGAEREGRQAEANRSDTIWRRICLAYSYCYSYRSLGWSTGTSRTKFKVPSVASSRLRAILPHLYRGVRFYVLWDAAIGLFSLHHGFASLSTAGATSIYEPLTLPLIGTLPSSLSALVMTFGWGWVMYFCQAFPAALFAVGFILFSPDWRTTALHQPPLFNAWWACDSLSTIWSTGWHTLYRSSMLFIGYYPLKKIGGRLAGVLGTFILSGLFHAVGYFCSGSEIPRTRAVRMFDFFIVNGLAITAEAAFERLVGRRVGGLAGRVWVWTFLLLSGAPLVEASLRDGAAVGLGAVPEGEGLFPFGRPVISLARWIRDRVDV